MSEDNIPEYLRGLNPIDTQIADIQNRLKSMRASGVSENSQQMHELNSRLKQLWDEKINPKKKISKPRSTYTTPEEIDKSFQERKANAASLNQSKKYEDTRR